MLTTALCQPPDTSRAHGLTRLVDPGRVRVLPPTKWAGRLDKYITHVTSETDARPVGVTTPTRPEGDQGGDQDPVRWAGTRETQWIESATPRRFDGLGVDGAALLRPRSGRS